MKEVSVVFGGKAFQETLQCRRQAVVRFISAVFVRCESRASYVTT